MEHVNNNKTPSLLHPDCAVISNAIAIKVYTYAMNNIPRVLVVSNTAGEESFSADRVSVKR